jgi:hypothetical protein
LIGRHIETLENQNEDREIVRRVINLRDQRIASLQEKISKSNKDSDHYAWPDPKDRKKIVDEYRAGKVSGEIKNKELWAQSNYHIGAKTLKAYEDEFPIGNVTIPNNS